MNVRHELDRYISQARRRLQWVLASQGAALLAGSLLLLTLLAAVGLRAFAFSDGVVLVARLLLLAAVLSVATFVFLRLRALRRDGGSMQLERALPAQGGRIATYLQESGKQPGKASVLLDLLAEDAQRIAEGEPIARAIPARRLWLPGALAALGVAGLVGALLQGGGLGEAAQRLWLGRLPPAASIAAAAGGIAVRPGDATVRRNQDLDIAALVARGGNEVTVHVRFDGGGEWETAAMQADDKGGYAFTLFAVRDAARYYVTSGAQRSAEHRITVVDLPQIESMRLTYNYPAWTGLARRTEEAGGDIRAVSGTRVGLEVVTDKPLEGPLLVINGEEAGLAQTGVTSRGNIAVKQAGHYRIATRFGDEIVPLTGDYVIEVVVDEKPTVEILRPGRDYRATSIEEVPVSVRARDDFRLEALELHYSVNGGDWRRDALPAGSPDVQAAALLRLEEMQQRGPQGEAPLLVPGDLVSYYALARDHGSSTQTDLFLIQVQPFERRFTQSQANGGGGGGGGGEEDEGQISQRQREVLLATWNLQRNRDAAGDREAERAADNARMLAEVQQTLADQATTLVERAKARMLTGQDENVANFVKSLEEAAKAMKPAVKSLNEQELQAAVKHEQQALQHLLRAEASFRDIQVAMQSPSGGGGGGAQAGRDVSEMTELELDLEKNQYETEPQMSAQQRGQAEDETLRRLRELARRQEQLAREAARRNTPAEAQRWQQEQLRREAEQLRQQLEQLAQERGQQQGGQQGSQQSSSSSAGAASAAQAAQQVAQALQQMQQAQARGDRQAAARASEQLNRAREQLERGRQQADQERFANLTESARELNERQQTGERDLRAAIGNRPPPSIANPRNQSQSGMSFEQMEQLSSARRELQTDLESLRRQIDTTRRQAATDAPRASERLAQAAQELQESDASGSLARSARDIERGRAAQAAMRESLVGESLQRLQESLDEAAAVAASENGSRPQSTGEADAGDLLAELGELRRALERARQQGLAQNQRGGGEPGAQSPTAREGQNGQGGGETGQQGQGGQGQSGQGGSEPGEQGGANGGADGGEGDFGRAGSGDRMGGGDGRFVGGLRSGRERVPLSSGERQALRTQTQLSAQRLQQLREQLRNGTLAAADVAALQELSQRLRRTGADPMAAEYQRMVSLLSQLELAALKSQQANDTDRPARTAESVDDSRRYRDNVAEYYRKLGVANDR